MKLTRNRLKQIIKEEISRLDEIKPEEAAISTAKSAADQAARIQGYATAEDAMDRVNGSEDPELLNQIIEFAEAILERTSRLSDNAMAAACEATLNISGLQEIIDNINRIHKEGGVPEQGELEPHPSQTMGSFESK